MKVKFSRVVNFIPTWNGNADLPPEEQVSVKLTAMKFGDLLATLSEMPKNITANSSEMTPEAKSEFDGNNVKVISSLAKDILPKYAEVFNLSDDDGPVDIGAVSNYAEYTGLSTELFMKLLAISSPQEGDEKNSPKP